MPSTSAKQHRFMEMIAHDPKKAKQLGIKQSVGQDFVAADKGKKFAIGGMPQAINKQKTHHTDGGVPNFSIKKYAGLKGGGMAVSKLFKGKETYKEELNEAKAIKSGKISPTQYAKGEESEKAMNCGGKVKKMAKGGSVKTSPSRDGIAVKGKTKGRMV